jgi:hypothetical protein
LNSENFEMQTNGNANEKASTKGNSEEKRNGGATHL